VSVVCKVAKSKIRAELFEVLSARLLHNPHYLFSFLSGHDNTVPSRMCTQSHSFIDSALLSRNILLPTLASNRGQCSIQLGDE
jgi:hypothetical protein